MKTKLLAALFSLSTLAGCTFDDATNDIYLIPEGYEGYVYAFYNVKNAPKVKKEGDYDVHNINKDGYFATSTPDMDYGTVTDKYFYVDTKGQRTKIDEECIRGIGTGGYESEPDSANKIDIKYTGVEVKKSGCSREFAEFGDGMGPEDLNSVLSEVTQKYYGVDWMSAN